MVPASCFPKVLETLLKRFVFFRTRSKVDERFGLHLSFRGQGFWLGMMGYRISVLNGALWALFKSFFAS